MSGFFGHLPPVWMTRDAVEDVIRRRLSHAPAFGRLVQATPDNVDQYLEWNRDYALLALYPPSERPAVESRMRRFGQGFPGLFTVNGDPRAHDVRSHVRNAPTFVGELQIERPGPLLVGQEPFKAIFVSSCLFRIEPDASIKIGGILLRSDSRAPKRFRYRIHFSYIAAFGKVLSPFNFIESLETELVLSFGADPAAEQRQEVPMPAAA